jgi:heptaprenyl diphosphate synthase
VICCPDGQRTPPVVTSVPVTPPYLAAVSRLVSTRLQVLVGALPEPMTAPVSELSARPAKRLRAMLLGSCARYGNPDRDLVIRLGALVELLHLASLLHDDVVDRAATRRGGPAVHVLIGQEQAVLAGLACFALAGMEAASIDTEVSAIVASAVAGVAYGEVLDVDRAFDTEVSLDDYLDLAERKTGELFRLACLLGAAAAGADDVAAAAFGRFGADFGVGFQVLDDCVDLQEIGPGKPAGTDLLMGVFGAPILCALAADSSGRLAEILLSPAFGRSDMPKVRALVSECGGVAAATALAAERCQRALGWLDALGDCEAAGLLTAVLSMAALSGR